MIVGVIIGTALCLLGIVAIMLAWRNGYDSGRDDTILEVYSKTKAGWAPMDYGHGFIRMCPPPPPRLPKRAS